jgi:hypothetical protein
MTPPITNMQRATWAKAALLGYSQAKDETSFLYEEPETVFGDMLCDLMHFANLSGFDWTEHIARARMHFDTEKADEGGAS